MFHDPPAAPFARFFVPDPGQDDSPETSAFLELVTAPAKKDGREPALGDLVPHRVGGLLDDDLRTLLFYKPHELGWIACGVVVVRVELYACPKSEMLQDYAILSTGKGHPIAL